MILVDVGQRLLHAGIGKTATKGNITGVLRELHSAGQLV